MASTGGGEQEEVNPLRRSAAESLGWITESSIQPKKRKYIDGVGASTLVGLQAQVYKAQSAAAAGLPNAAELRKHKLAKAKKPNKGVFERNEKDIQQERATEAPGITEALERKAQLYERIIQGRADDKEDLYSVDFLKKGYLESEQEKLDTNRSSGGHDEVYGVRLDSQRMQSEDMKRESERVDWEAEQAKIIAAEALEQEQRRKRKEVIDELAAETKIGRNKASRLKATREAQVQRNREKLKAAYMEQQRKKAQVTQGENVSTSSS